MTLVVDAVVCSRVRGLQEALSSDTIALEISTRNARVAALQTPGPAARRPRPGPGSAERRHRRRPRRRQVCSAGTIRARARTPRIDPRGGGCSRRAPCSRAQGCPGIGAGEDARRVAQAPRRLAGFGACIPRQCRARRRATADGWRNRLESDPRRGEAAPQMGDRASADSLRWNLDLVLDQRGAGIADLPGGASGMLCRDYTGKEADKLVAHRPRRGLAGRRTARPRAGLHKAPRAEEALSADTIALETRAFRRSKLSAGTGCAPAWT
jgi:hypothetical protein